MAQIGITVCLARCLKLSNLLLLFGIGLTTGTLPGLFGVGGGFILIPLLTLAGVSIKSAVALSLTYIIGTGLAGVFRHYKQQTLDLVLAVTLSLSAIITAQLGVQLTLGLSASVLKLGSGLLTVSVALFYSLRPVPKSSETMPEGSVLGQGSARKGFWGKSKIMRHNAVASRIITTP